MSAGAARPAGHDRRYLHLPTGLGDRVADRLATLVGSWHFVLGQNWVVLLWMIWNTATPWKFDPPPFIGLNLLFSWQASNTGPVLQMTGNRQAARDRLRDDHEATEVDEMTALLAAVHEIAGATLDMQQQQMAILSGQNAILAELRAARGADAAPPVPRPARRPRQASRTSPAAS